MFTLKIITKKKESNVPEIVELNSRNLSFFARKSISKYLGLEKEKNYKIKIEVEEV